MAKTSEAQLRASKKWNKAHRKETLKNYKKVQLELHLSNDSDIINKLDKVPSKQGYIKALIRSDISKEQDVDQEQS